MLELLLINLPKSRQNPSRCSRIRDKGIPFDPCVISAHRGGGISGGILARGHFEKGTKVASLGCRPHEIAFSMRATQQTHSKLTFYARNRTASSARSATRYKSTKPPPLPKCFATRHPVSYPKISMVPANARQPVDYAAGGRTHAASSSLRRGRPHSRGSVSAHAIAPATPPPPQASKNRRT